MTSSTDAGPRAPAWRSRDVLRVAVIIVAVYATAQLLWTVRLLLVTAFLGVLFGLAVAAGTDRLQRYRVPRGLSAPLIVLGFIGLLGAFGTWIGPSVREQSVELRTKLPQALDKLENWIEHGGGGVITTILGLDTDRGAERRDTVAAPVVPQTPRLSLRDRVITQIGGVRRYFLPVLSSTVAVVAGLLLVLFLAIYTAIDPYTYRKGVLYLVPAKSRPRVEGMLAAVSTQLRRWLLTQLIAMVVIGVVTTITLVALDVRAAIPLGILAGLLEFIPTVGPILSAIPAIAMGFVDSPEKALYVTIAYVAIQFLENHILIPVLMKESIDIPPALTILAQALAALVFGFLGLLIAVPVLAAVLVAIKRSEIGGGPATADAGSSQ